MDRAEQLSLLSGFVAEQWGLVTSAQAKGVGLSGVQLLRLTDAALLESVGHGVYLLTAAGQPRHLEIKVAWLRLQPAVPTWERSTEDPAAGVISHASACQLLELGDIPAPEVEISVRRRRVATDPSVRLRTAVIEPSDITVIDGLPVTTARRTILDLLSAKADGGHVGGVIADAERRDLISTEAMASEVGRFTRRYGMPRNSDGRALIEHLVSQAGESLRSAQLERAAQAGFDSALELFRARDPQLKSARAWEQLLGRTSSADLSRLFREATRPSYKTQLERTIEELTQSSTMSAIRDAAASSLRDSLKLPPLVSPELQRTLRGATQPSPAILQAIRALQRLQEDPGTARRAIDPPQDEDWVSESPDSDAGKDREP